jgi:hypothetical protein
MKSRTTKYRKTVGNSNVGEIFSNIIFINSHLSSIFDGKIEKEEY